ncbi:MAG: TetR/AcrR family transcriptional regulator [Acidimicrobiia bacterium]|nr:TetR/AcrR family transcriptional regulator [Acidimicrobiia bacterium]
MSTTGDQAPGRPRAQSRKSKADRLTKLLLQAAAEEFIARGYEGARVSDIARRVGVTSGAVYARWPHKTDVIVAALEYMFERILPDQELESLGGTEGSPDTMLAMLGTNLMHFDPNKEVVVQVFGGARNNEAIRASLLAYLNKEAEQLSQYVEQAKNDGLFDPDISTAAVTLLCQSIGIGSHLLLSAGLDERHVPSTVEWESLLWTLISAAIPAESSGDP